MTEGESSRFSQEVFLQEPFNAYVEDGLECSKKVRKQWHHQKEVSKAEMEVLAVEGLTLVCWMHVACT